MIVIVYLRAPPIRAFGAGGWLFLCLLSVVRFQVVSVAFGDAASVVYRPSSLTGSPVACHKGLRPARMGSFPLPLGRWWETTTCSHWPWRARWEHGLRPPPISGVFDPAFGLMGPLTTPARAGTPAWGFAQLVWVWPSTRLYLYGLGSLQKGLRPARMGENPGRVIRLDLNFVLALSRDTA